MKTLPQIQTNYSSMNNLLYLSYLPVILNAAIEAGIFEALYQKGKNLDTLAATLQTEKNITEALCDILIEIDLLATVEGKYRLTPVAAEFLILQSPVNQLLDVQKYSGSSGPFDNLLNALKGEKPEFDHKMWANRNMAKQMEQQARGGAIQSVVQFITSLPDFHTYRKMCDLAGNIGYYSAALCAKNENLHAEVLDLPEVLAFASEFRKNDKRVIFHNFNIENNTDFSVEYDLFFISHFLYGHGADNSLTSFLQRVNRAMIMGGTFVSHHIATNKNKEMNLTMKMVELMTKAMGYATHTLPIATLKDSLTQAGFAEFTVKDPDPNLPFPATLVAAKKISEAEKDG